LVPAYPSMAGLESELPRRSALLAPRNMTAQEQVRCTSIPLADSRCRSEPGLAHRGAAELPGLRRLRPARAEVRPPPDGGRATRPRMAPLRPGTRLLRGLGGRGPRPHGPRTAQRSAGGSLLAPRPPRRMRRPVLEPHPRNRSKPIHHFQGRNRAPWYDGGCPAALASGPGYSELDGSAVTRKRIALHQRLESRGDEQKEDGRKTSVAGWGEWSGP